MRDTDGCIFMICYMEDLVVWDNFVANPLISGNWEVKLSVEKGDIVGNSDCGDELPDLK